MSRILFTRRKLLQGGAVSMGMAFLKPPQAQSTALTPSPGEWTLEAAKKFWEPMKRPVEHVGVPGCEWQTGVYWDGSLLCGPTLIRGESYIHPLMAEEATLLGNSLLHLSIAYGDPMRFVDRMGARNPAIRRSLEEGRLPIPVVETQDGGLVWQETVFAHLLGRKMAEASMKPRREDVLVTHVHFKVRNRGDRAQQGHLWFYFGDTSQTKKMTHIGAELDRPLAHRLEPPFGWMEEKVRYVLPSSEKGQLRWHDELPPPEGMWNSVEKLIEWVVPLASGEEAELKLLLPFGLIGKSTAEQVLALQSDVLHEEVSEFWRELIKGTGGIETPEAFVNDYLAAVPGQMAQQVGLRHVKNLWMYKTSPNWYENYYPANAAKALPTFDLRGLTNISRPVLQSFIDFQTDDPGILGKDRRRGAPQDSLHRPTADVGEGFVRHPGLLGNFGLWTANLTLKCHGCELWALASHYRITRDEHWLGLGPGSPLQAMLDAFDWVAVQRRRTMRERNGKKVRHWGLLPAASAHDWLSGNTVFADSECIFGMIETVRLLREIGHPRAEEVARELNDYRTCLRNRYVEARDLARPVPLPGGGQIPYVPRDVYELDWAKVDWTYASYGPLRAAGQGAFDPHDPLADQALAFLDAGKPKDGGREFFWRHYVEPETMWPMYEVFLQRDELGRFFELFFHNFTAAIYHGFRVGCEARDDIPSVAPGEAERWRMVRDMFVNERGGYDGGQQSLWLLQAIPRSWLKPVSRLSAKQMGTHFGGLVDLEAEVANDGNSITVSTKLNLVVSPTEIRMRLRSGDGRSMAAVQINGHNTPVLERDTIKLPAEIKGEYKIIGQFA